MEVEPKTPDVPIVHSSYVRLSSLKDIITDTKFRELTNKKDISELSESEAKAIISRLDLLYPLAQKLGIMIESLVGSNQKLEIIDATALVNLILPHVIDTIIDEPKA